MGDSDFKHITVTAAEEDDFVIRAGVVNESATEEASEARTETPSAAIGDRATEKTSTRPPDPVPASETEAKASTPQTQNASSRGKTSGRKDDAYHETTMEDLYESGPMPLKQRIIIIAAIVCIIGAIVYCFAFMR